jgi:hypothetical protein
MTHACFVEAFPLTLCFSGGVKRDPGENRLNGFSFSYPALTALKHGVNENDFYRVICALIKVHHIRLERRFNIFSPGLDFIYQLRLEATIAYDDGHG